MPADAIEGVAENHGGANLGIMKGFTPHVVAGAEQLLPRVVPDAECEMA